MLVRILGYGGRNERETGGFNLLNLETHPDGFSLSGSCPASSLMPRFSYMVSNEITGLSLSPVRLSKAQKC